LGRRQSSGRRGERVSYAVRGQDGRAAGACVHAPRETVALWRVRRVISGWGLHHLRPVAAHRNAAGPHRNVRGGAGRGVLGAVRRPTGAHDRCTTGSGGGYAPGARNRHTTTADH